MADDPNHCSLCRVRAGLPPFGEPYKPEPPKPLEVIDKARLYLKRGVISPKDIHGIVEAYVKLYDEKQEQTVPSAG